MPTPRTLAIGDVHGCLNALETLLDFADVSTEDRLITLGDYIDRGPESQGVIDYLLELQETHQITCLKGNHEEMMELAKESLEGARFWMMNGGVATMESFDAPDLFQIPPHYWKFFDECFLYLETDTHIFVHAGVRPDLPMEEQPEHNLLWQRINQTTAHQSEKIIVCGHTPQRDGYPLVKPGVICIDTFAFGDGWLTCLDVDSGNYWQANEYGGTHEGKIDLREAAL